MRSCIIFYIILGHRIIYCIKFVKLSRELVRHFRVAIQIHYNFDLELFTVVIISALM